MLPSLTPHIVTVSPYTAIYKFRDDYGYIKVERWALYFGTGLIGEIIIPHGAVKRVLKALAEGLKGEDYYQKWLKGEVTPEMFVPKMEEDNDD